MKKTLLLLASVFAMLSAVAQVRPDTTKIPGKHTTPQAVKDRFTNDYPNITPEWGNEGSNYYAQYTDLSSNKSKRVIYDRNGNFMSSEAEVDNSVYPVAISDYYSKNFPNEKYTVWSSQDGNGNITYYSKRKNKDVIWFDKDGNYTKTKTAKTNKSTNSSSSTKGSAMGK